MLIHDFAVSRKSDKPFSHGLAVMDRVKSGPPKAFVLRLDLEYNNSIMALIC